MSVQLWRLLPSPLWFLQEECLQTCQETLLMCPVGIVCQLRKNQVVPKCRVFLTLKNETRSCITENTKWWFWEKYFPSFQMFFTNDEFERMDFFSFFLSFWMLKIRIFNGFLKVALKLVYMQKEVCLNNAASVMLSIFACFTSIWTNRRSLCACWTCSVHTTAHRCSAVSAARCWVRDSVTVESLSVPKSCCQILQSREFWAHYLLCIGLVPRTIECRQTINLWLDHGFK